MSSVLFITVWNTVLSRSRLLDSRHGLSCRMTTSERQLVNCLEKKAYLGLKYSQILRRVSIGQCVSVNLSVSRTINVRWQKMEIHGWSIKFSINQNGKIFYTANWNVSQELHNRMNQRSAVLKPEGWIGGRTAKSQQCHPRPTQVSSWTGQLAPKIKTWVGFNRTIWL